MYASVSFNRTALTAFSLSLSLSRLNKALYMYRNVNGLTIEINNHSKTDIQSSNTPNIVPPDTPENQFCHSNVVFSVSQILERAYSLRKFHNIIQRAYSLLFV